MLTALFALSYVAGGTFAATKALRNLFLERTVNVDLLMVTAAIGAAFVNAWAEGAVLLGLFSTSNALEHFALGRTQHAVKALMDLSPDVATVMRPGAPGGEVVVPVEALTLSDVVLVRPGERIAVDGTVTSGESTVDQAAITGESMPVAKRLGDGVFAGTINGNGAIQVRVTKLARGEHAVARSSRLSSKRASKRAETQRFTDAFEGKYAIGVIVVSALVAILPPLVGDTSLNDSFYRAMTLLVVASPCALVISTPASTLSALANAARHGILFKGSNHLENAGTVQTVAFDKTGTLTEGRPRVTAIVALNGTSEQELLRLTASAERLSEHHIAEAVVLAAQERGLTLSDPTDFQAIPGKGIVAHIDGCEVIIGNEMLLTEFGVETDIAAMTTIEQLRAAGNSAIFIANRGTVRGVIAVADTIRPQAAAAVQELKRLGIQRTVMLTGDNQRVADAICRPARGRRSPGRSPARREARYDPRIDEESISGDGRRRCERCAGVGDRDNRHRDGRRRHRCRPGNGRRRPHGRRPLETPLRHLPQPPHPPHHHPKPRLFPLRDRRIGNCGLDHRHPITPRRRWP